VLHVRKSTWIDLFSFKKLKRYYFDKKIQNKKPLSWW
jgi:hypothetical protein